MTSILNASAEILLRSDDFAVQPGYIDIATLTDGTFVVAYSITVLGSPLDSLTRPGFMVVRHYDANGRPLGAAIEVDQTNATAEYGHPRVTALLDGGFIVAYGQSNGNVSFQTFDADAQKVGDPTTYNASQAATLTDMTTAVSGREMPVFQRTQDGLDVYYPVRDTFSGIFDDSPRANLSTTGDQQEGVIAALPNTNYVVAWASSVGDDLGASAGIIAQIFAEDGSRIGGEVVVNSYQDGPQSRPAITTLLDGGFVIAWQTNDDALGSAGIAAQRFDADGNRVGGEFTVNTTTALDQSRPQIVGLNDGGFVVVWDSVGQDGSGLGIFSQRFDDQGHALGPETRVNTYTNNDQSHASLSALADGGYVVAWISSGQGGIGLFQRVFSSAASLSGSQTLYGTSEGDDLDGGASGDRMYGGFGDDVYHVNSAQDVVVEAANQGEDTVHSTITLTLGADVENLVQDGVTSIDGVGNGLGNLMIGNAGNNSLFGLGGADRLYGGVGNDNLMAGDGNDVVYGEDGDDFIDGGIGHDTLIGGQGDDRMSGGAGNDKLYGGDQDDTFYASTGVDYIYGGTGLDIYDLEDTEGAAVVNLTRGRATQGANIAVLDSIENVIGTSYDDQLTGSAEGNLLDGAGGADTMRGLAGDDTYGVDNVADVVIENAGEGIDMVQASISYTLAANFEDLTLIGSLNLTGDGNSADNVLNGNAGNNRLDGKGGADSFFGDLGDDTYVIDSASDVVTELLNQGVDTIEATLNLTLGANVENLTLLGVANLNGIGNELDNVLKGNSGTNSLTGLGGNDFIDGGLGIDQMSGGIGNDTFVVDNAGDVIVENAGEGTDTVQTALSYTLGTNFENLTLTGAGNLTGNGNAVANTLIGNDGNNRLDGKVGVDTMSGGLGNDTYVVDNAADVTNELPGQGVDTVETSVDYTLAANLENLTLLGASNRNGVGNGLDNVLKGNSGANTLKGLDGADTINGLGGSDSLYGGSGADTFQFSLASGLDTIRDFSAAANDLINVNAYTLGVAFAAGVTITADGLGNTIINLGGGNTVTVTATSVADVSAHMVW